MTLRPHIPLLFLTLLLPPAALTQTTPADEPANAITLRLLDADSGQPVSNLRVTIYSNTGGKGLPIVSEGDLYEVNVNGLASLRLGAIASTGSMTSDFTACVSPGIPAFEVKQIQTKGISPQNKCSRKRHPAAPGELIIFVRKTHWWMRWKDLN
jgi:hypothetical protein